MSKHTAGQWVNASESMPNEYQEVYAKHEDGSIRIARLSKSEGGCWQLATFLVDTKRPGYAWPVDKVVEWRAIEPATDLSISSTDLLEALRDMLSGWRWPWVYLLGRKARMLSASLCAEHPGWNRTHSLGEYGGGDKFVATRRAIVRAAAEIGRAMP